MADVAIAVQQLTRSGAAPTYTGSLSAANTYYTKNNGNVFLHIKKSGAGTSVPTVQTPTSVDGNAIAERTLTTVPASTGDIMAGPFPPDVYNDANGDMRYSFSEITGLTVAAVQVG